MTLAQIALGGLEYWQLRLLVNHPPSLGIVNLHHSDIIVRAALGTCLTADTGIGVN